MGIEWAVGGAERRWLSSSCGLGTPPHHTEIIPLVQDSPLILNQANYKSATYAEEMSDGYSHAIAHGLDGTKVYISAIYRRKNSNHQPDLVCSQLISGVWLGVKCPFPRHCSILYLRILIPAPSYWLHACSLPVAISEFWMNEENGSVSTFCQLTQRENIVQKQRALLQFPPFPQ